MVKPLIALVLCGNLCAQDSIRNLDFSLYAEAYYTHVAGHPAADLMPGYYYNYKVKDAVSLNLAMAAAKYKGEYFRASLGIMAGNYSYYNLATEPGGVKNIYELNAGVRVSEKWNMWVDAGVMPSHIGFETPIGADCWTLTRSLQADNSPYYETGGRISAKPRSNVYAALLILNGWQRIRPLYQQPLPAFGSQLTVDVTRNVQVNWSTYAGNSYPRGSERWRYFSNLYVTVGSERKTGFIAGFDYGLQQRFDERTRYDSWLSLQAVVRHRMSRKVSFAARAEHYADPQQVIIGTAARDGAHLTAFSFNTDVRVLKVLIIRAEVKRIQGTPASILPAPFVPSNYVLTGAVCLQLL